MNKPLALLVFAIAVAVLLWTLASPPSSEAEAAAAFFQKNRKTLLEAVSIAKKAKLPERIEEEDPQSLPPGCASGCLSGYKRLIGLQRDMRVPAIVVHEQCYGAGKCSISFLIGRKGIAVSGSGTELIYDENPDWGTFRIVPLAAAPRGWYYRHLE